MFPTLVIIHAVHLRLHIDTYVQTDLGVDEAVLQAEVVVLVAVLGVVALCGVRGGPVYMAVIIVDAEGMVLHEGVKDAGHGAVTVVEAIGIIIGELQEMTRSKGFCVGDAGREVMPLVAGVVVLYFMVDTVSAGEGKNLIIIDL